MIRPRTSIGSLVLAGFVAFAFSVAPVGLDYDFSPETKSAFAKGKGSGKSGSKGGGSKRSSKSSSGGGNGVVPAHAQGNGQDAGIESEDEDEPNAKGKLASEMGNLNAAHASPTALLNANENSIVGKLADYFDEYFDAELATQQEELGNISNKADEDGLVSEDVVDEVNSLLDEQVAD